MVFDANLDKCPHCGGTEPKEKIHKTMDGIIVPLDEYTEIKSYYYSLCRQEMLYNRKPNWKYFKLYERYKSTAMKYAGEFSIPSWIPKIWLKAKEEKKSGTVYR
jgi:hypothetical protein